MGSLGPLLGGDLQFVKHWFIDKYYLKANYWGTWVA